MALIAMVVYCTDDNQKLTYLKKSIKSIAKTVDLKKHRFLIVDNASNKETKDWFIEIADNNYFGEANVTLLTNDENIGTARAINLAWKLREPGENCIKIDDDMVINTPGWVELMEEAIQREPRIGQIGVKRKDCWEHPDHENPELRSRLMHLNHTAGEKWIVVEQAKHIMGSCVMHSAALLDRIGYLYQPGIYGYDDVLMSWRSHLAGFMCCFLPQIDVDHIDPGGTEFTFWKHRHSGQYTKQVSDLVDKYISRETSLYYEP